jgi:ubiquinone/menaquinone biosynthesis C-methylase UbiE
MESSDLALRALASPINVPGSQQAADHAAQLSLLQRFLNPATTFLELCGDDYSLALTIADGVKRTYAAVDISAVPITGQRLPANFHLALAHRANVPAPSSSIDVAYTRCRLDLLRPAEVLDLLAEVYRALVPRGTFLCMAINRLVSPPDQLAGHGTLAARTTYTIAQLRAMLRKVGFRRVTQYVRWRDTYAALPSSVLRLFEIAVGELTSDRGARTSSSSILRAALDIRLAARK